MSAAAVAGLIGTSAPRAVRSGASEGGSGCSRWNASRVSPRGADAAGWAVSPQLIRNGIRPSAVALRVARHRSTVPSGVVRCPPAASPGS